MKNNLIKIDIIKIIDLTRNIIGLDAYKEYADMLTVDVLTNYTIQQRYQRDKEVRNRFIDVL